MRQGQGGSHHVAFTRILHRTKPDALMTEVGGTHVHYPAIMIFLHTKGEIDIWQSQSTC